MSMSEHINKTMLGAINSIATKNQVAPNNVRIQIALQEKGVILEYKAVPGTQPAYIVSLSSLIGILYAAAAGGKLKAIFNKLASEQKEDPKKMMLEISEKGGMINVGVWRNGSLEKTLLITDLI